jgi:hypothetical protein
MKKESGKMEHPCLHIKVFRLDADDDNLEAIIILVCH